MLSKIDTVRHLIHTNNKRIQLEEFSANILLITFANMKQSNKNR